MLEKDIDGCFEELYPIYRDSFPDGERRTREGQREAMGSPCYRLLTRREEGKLLAFLGYWDLPGCRFIEHLATTAACRGRGYGRELVEECVGGSVKPVFLEIEPVTDEAPMTGRRARFYERLGFVINEFPYEQLPLKEGDHPCPLWVMSRGRRYTQEEFLPFKKEIYREVYRNADYDGQRL